jgi:hypothetical protein
MNFECRMSHLGRDSFHPETYPVDVVQFFRAAHFGRPNALN